MKKKVLLSSIATIALCFCLIVGSTYALFTDYSELDIEVTSGNVTIDADITNLELWSVTPNEAGDVVDENGGRYIYEDQTQKGEFLNTGDADFDGNVLTITKITPGDKVVFDIEGANTSNVSILMRYVIEIDENDPQTLSNGMVLYVDGRNYTGVTSYTSVWTPVAVGDDMVPVTVELGLPVYAGNEYESTTAKYNVRVEAVQGNADVAYDNPIVEVANAISDAGELADAIADPFLETIVFDAPVAATITADVANKTFYANGNDIALDFDGALENVVVEGIVTDGTSNINIDLNNATGDIKIANSTFEKIGGNAIKSGSCDLEVENCDFIGGKYSTYNFNPAASLTYKNCTFKNMSSWAIQVNSNVAIAGDLVIEGCTFENVDGVCKLLNGVDGSITFNSNTMIDAGRGDDSAKILVSTKNDTPMTCAGGKFDDGNNTFDGASWALN